MKRDLISPRTLSCALVALLLAGPATHFTGSSAARAEAREPAMAPLNPRFIPFMDTRRETGHSGDYPMGYRPSPVDLSHVKGMIGPGEKASSYPASYDLRDEDKLTPVRDQGSCGSCWTFGTYASLESYLKPAETRDFSEQDLNKYHGFDWGECDGGNAFMSHAYLARWSGPINESDVPYPYALDADSAFAPLKHVQQVVYLPERANATDNDTIKQFLTTDGALYFAFYSSRSTDYWNPTTNSYYYNGGTNANHAVAVVGWDDNYDRNRFSTAPDANGAFIAKNSWGTDWGDDGFFYISYYDTSLQEFVSFNNAEAPTNYAGVYQYDPLGYVGDLGYGTTIAWAANVFTATGNHSLSAVGFITNDVNAAYTLYVYTGVSPGRPRSGSLAATKAGTNAYPGYVTVDLDTPVALATGTSFSIVIAFQNSAYAYPVPLEYRISGYSSAATSNPGESFISPDGNEWEDYFVDYSSYRINNTIKGFFSNTGDTTLYVSKDGDCGKNTPCFSTIQAALNVAENGATIKATRERYPEAPAKNTAGSVSITGGWNSTFTDQTGITEMYAPRVTGGGTLKLLPHTGIVAPQ